MLRCCTFGCCEKVIEQCNSCNGILLCRFCRDIHSSKHLENNSQCAFGNISVRLSKDQLIKLRNKIEDSKRAIENQ